MRNQQPRIAVVTRETRLKGLLRRWATKGQAKFVFRKARAMAAAESLDAPQAVALSEQAADEDFDFIETEDRTYQESIQQLVRSLDFGMPVQVIDRQYLPNFDFGLCAAVVVIGQDGLVANTAKYALEVPIVGVNPDPSRFDGVLLPFQLREARPIVQRVLKQQARIRDVTLAQATLHDGQKLLAFNDLFVGVNSHVSARYQLRAGDRQEEQSSSGILVSTGAGSTGWMSSVINMACGVAAFLGVPQPEHGPHMSWEDRRLLWAVREPFVSRTTQASLVMGRIADGEELMVESLMPASGVIFSDGVESDFLEFNAGSIARITTAAARARLVVN
jgi:NAD kinase